MRTKFTLLLVASGLHPGIAFGQCSSTVPANAVVITSTTMAIHNQSNTNFWLCDGAFQQAFTGNNNTFWVESDAFFNTFTGSNNTINYKGTLAMGVYGSNNIIYATSEAAISDQGTGNTINVCGANGVVFNYGNAPDGCTTVGIEEMEHGSYSAHYDPLNDLLVVDDPLRQLREIHIHDAAGRQMGSNSTAGTPVFPLSKYPSGLYIVRLVTDDGMRSYRFVK